MTYLNIIRQVVVFYGFSFSLSIVIKLSKIFDVMPVTINNTYKMICRNFYMDVKTDSEAIMRQLIKLMKTQTAVAKALGQSKQVFNYWLNHANKVPFDQYLAMKALLEKKIGNYSSQACVNKDSKNTSINTEISGLGDSITISMRVHLAMEFEAQALHELSQIAPQKGIETSNLNNDKPSQKRVTLMASKRYAFDNKHDYLRAKKVVLANIPELTQAMDDQRITVRQAAKIIDTLKQQYTRQLIKNKPSTNSFSKNNTLKIVKSDRKNEAIKKQPISSAEIYNDEMLIQLEQYHQTPLRLILAGLLLITSDGKNQFLWDLVYLKSMLLPYVDLDFGHCFKVLYENGFIRKIKINDRIYGRIVFQKSVNVSLVNCRKVIQS